MSADVKWDGDEALAKIAENMLDALSAGGAYMVGAVRAEIRSQDLIDTGFYINSIDDEEAGPDRQRIGTNAHYAVYLEYGTSRMKAFAPFRKAMEDGHNQGNLAKIAAAAIGRGF